MDLALTRRGDDAVRAALCLARVGADGRYVKLRRERRNGGYLP
jgi:hypothetical protein